MLRLFSPLAGFGFLSALLIRASLAIATHDPCTNIAAQTFVDPADALACVRSFPFNETLRQNVLTVVSRVFDFYTFEDFYLNSPPPFQESTTNIRAQIQRINSTKYATDRDFNRDLWDFTTRLNDGHTRWLPSCYTTYNNLLPAPIVLLDTGVFIAPNSVELFDQLGDGFTAILAAKGFDWKRLAGAKVVEIGGLPVRQYIDKIAHTVSGNYLDHNIRVNSVVSSYRITDTIWSQRLGDHASEIFLNQTSVDFLLVPVESTSGARELVNVPFVAAFIGNNFTDGPSFWANNCAATNTTNGVVRSFVNGFSETQPRLARAALAVNPNAVIKLPDPFLPTLTPTNGSTGVIKSYILPGNKTGVMFVGSFEGNFTQFQFDVEAAVNQFNTFGVTRLLIDVTNNPGGFVCLGLFLHQYLVGTAFGLPGFQSTSRANPLAQKIVKTDIARRLRTGLSDYDSRLWLFPNGTRMPKDYDYITPSIPYIVNDRNQPTSQRFTDLCPTPHVPMPSTPPFDLNNVAIIGNGNCGSTCALFTTVMFERHGTKIATFGAYLDRPMEFKGTAGNQVLEWVDLDGDIKTAGLKNDPLAPPDLLVDGNMSHNWRAAYSYLNETASIAYRSEKPQYRFSYTKETYNNPQKVWTFAEENIFGHK